MKRRQFMKTAAATTLAPMLPGSLANGLPVSALQYAKAVEVANKWAYTTAYYLKIVLKVDDATSEAVLDQLQVDGILGPKGSTGLCIAKRFSVAKGSGIAKGASKIAETTNTATTSKSTPLKTAKKILLEDEAPTKDDDTKEQETNGHEEAKLP